MAQMAKPMCAHTNADDWSSSNCASRWRQMSGADGENLYALTQVLAIGRREKWRQDRGLPIVNSRPLGRERRIVRALQAPHWTLQAPHCRQRAIFSGKRRGRSTGPPWKSCITNSQATHSVMKDLLVQMGDRWCGRRGYGVNWLHEL